MSVLPGYKANLEVFIRYGDLATHSGVTGGITLTYSTAIFWQVI